MQKELLENISKNFEMLLPQNQESLLLLIALQSKIQNHEIEDSFTQRDFENTVEEVAKVLNREQTIQKESISKKLSQYFYTTLKWGNEYRFQLTVFSKELVTIVMNELSPEFEKVELIHTFRRTLKLEDIDLESIEKFDYWYRNHYRPSKKTILSHTENLHRSVDTKTAALRSLLRDNTENTKSLINSFITIFEELGRQTSGLSQTLSYKLELIDRVKLAEGNFLANKDAWDRYCVIRDEIELFFENIDNRVLSINDRIQLSSSRLKTLYDTLQYKQLYKLKIERFLDYLLLNSRHEKGEIILPTTIERKKIPYFREKFVNLPNINFTEAGSKEVPLFDEDQEYKALKEKENFGLLNRQESITKWLEDINKLVAAGKEISYNKWFKEIYSKEKNLEVPIEVCFGLVQKYGNNKHVTFTIDKNKPVNANEDLSIWSMKIQQSVS